MLSKFCFWVVAMFATTVLEIAQAQQSARVFKVGFLASGSASSMAARRDVLRSGLRELGYVEGKNLAFEERYAGDDFERLFGLTNELIAARPDVLVVISTPAAIAAQKASRSLPIIFIGVSDPIKAGLVDSLARPGGNLTGVTNIAAVLAGKRLELLKEALPKLSRVAVLWDPKAPGSTQQWTELQLPARELGLQLHSMEVSNPATYQTAFTEAAKARSTALAVTQNPLATSNRQKVAELAIKYRLPGMNPRDEFVTAGGLMSYGPDTSEPFRRAAVFVDKILKGTKPADIPVEQPMKIEFVVNLKTAKQIAVTIPPNVLARADRVIK